MKGIKGEDVKLRREAVKLVKEEKVLSQDWTRSEAFDQLESEQIFAQIKAEEKRDIIRMRGQWSRWILACIVGIVILDYFVVFFLGFGWIKFGSGYTVPLFIGESLIKIFGLAIIVVKFLFERDKKEK
ncbi:hypothetical protein COY23_04545 [bacterium (Candidatus Torokbacteria) CG_4_10_14_0_2_um_filter_35_8]|nr:MAG: hypothetical protein COY23_04545 [bacterium (Candidatus Torokbacteria) CG_4_10_14_0_2_um_filter_35_8]